jgi:uncharacterized membrane protein YgcG
MGACGGGGCGVRIWELDAVWVMLIVVTPFALLLALGLMARSRRRRGGRSPRRGSDGAHVPTAIDTRPAASHRDPRQGQTREDGGDRSPDAGSDGGGDGGGGGGD